MQSTIAAKKRPLPIIRVFVSSTFSDLKHERNALHAKVWPELERYCQQRGFTFQAIDLRWGVPAEAGLDHRTMRICFEELRRSQETSPEPNFLILLGNRYGWRPLPEVISVEEFEKLTTAAEQIQIEPPDLARKPSDTQVKLLKKAVVVLEDWYLLDENAKPFGEKLPIGEYILRSRKPLLNDLDYGRQPDANGILRDTTAWGDVQFVLWSIVNHAFSAANLAERFQALHETPSGMFPSSVRFQASATEQEIWQGALQVANADRHVIAAVREVVGLDAFPDSPQRGDFIDLRDDGTPDDNAQQALVALKAELERRLNRSPIIRSTCQWAIDQANNPTGDITTSHLDDFCREIMDRFKSIIVKQINAYWGCDLSAADATLAQVRGSQQELDLECADHLRFAGERAPEQTFVGRESELQRIRDYLHSETNQPFVVHGPSGSGKTALLGKIIQEVTPPRSADGTRAKTGPIVLTRFIGTTPESSNLRSLLSSLCRELRQDFEETKTRETSDGKTETFSPPLPADLNELIDEFYSQLGQATAARPVFVFLDALDQLDTADNGRSVFWIRSPLSSTKDAACHTRLVVSCLSPSDEFPEDSEACEPFRELKLRKLLGNHELGALEENDARQLFARWLHGAGRSVSETQQDTIWSAIQKSSACRQPLFLKVLFEEARRWRSFDPPFVIPASLALLLDELLTHLGKPSEHGELIGIALSCLVSARYGLSEGELLEILFIDPEYKALLAENNKRNGHELPHKSVRIPIAPWTRLRSDLAPYLSERAAPGTAVMHFYHRQVEQAVRKRYLQTPELRSSRHRRLALYFARQPWWLESRDSQRVRMRPPYSARRAHVRKVTELPHQLFRLAHAVQSAGMLAATQQAYQWIERLLRELPFLEAKNEAGLIFELPIDFASALDILPADRDQRHIIRLLDEALRRDLHFIARHSQDYPQALFQCLWNSGWWYDCPHAAGHYWDSWAIRARRAGLVLASLYTRIADFFGLGQARFRHAHMHKQMHAPYGKGVKLSSLLDTWRARKDKMAADLCWVRSLRPPSIHLGTTQLAVLRGHEGWVSSVAFPPDGRRIASASYDKTVRVWDTASGSEKAVLRGHEGWVYSVAFSPDGRRIVSGSEDMTVRVWDTASGVEMAALRGHEGPVFSVAFSPDGQRIASASYDKTVRVWDAASGSELAVFHGHENSVISVAYSPDGQWIASGAGQYLSGEPDTTVRVWDADSGVEKAVLRGHEGWVYSVAFSPDGRRIVSGSEDMTVRVWDAASGAERAVLDQHQDAVYSVAFSPDGRRIVSGSRDETVRIWDAATSAELVVLCGHEGSVATVRYSPDGRRIASGAGDKTVRVWDAACSAELAVLRGHEQHVLSVAYSPDGRRIASAADDPTVRVWDAASGAELAVLRGHEQNLKSENYSPDGRWIASRFRWSPQVAFVAYSPDGRRIVSGSRDKTVRVWDAASGAKLAVLRGHENEITSAAWSHNGRRIVSGSRDKTVRVWDAASGAKLAVLRGHEESVNRVAFSPDGRQIVSGASDSTVRVWDAASGAELAVLRGHERPIKSVAYSPDGGRIASGAFDETVRVWDAASGAELAVLRGHENEITSVAWSPDGQRLVSGDTWGKGERTVRVWDAETFACIEIIKGTTDLAAFAAGSTQVPWRAIGKGLETVIEEAATSRPTAWFPAALNHISTSPDSRTWAGAVSNYFCLIQLEGNAGPTRASQ